MHLLHFAGSDDILATSISHYKILHSLTHFICRRIWRSTDTRVIYSSSIEFMPHLKCLLQNFTWYYEGECLPYTADILSSLLVCYPFVKNFITDRYSNFNKYILADDSKQTTGHVGQHFSK